MTNRFMPTRMYRMTDVDGKIYTEMGTSVSDVMAFMARSFPQVEVAKIEEVSSHD